YRDHLIGDPAANYFYVCEPVHNLVHREVMQPDGLSFHTERLPTETQSEVVASSDNWFRPVYVRTGPDGCLYVADMYRLVIEHPEWIPMDWQRQVDVRSGTDKGRIYRITPAAAKVNAANARRTDLAIPINKLTTEQLVARLGHVNGWHRDISQQQLVWRNDPKSISLLQNTLASTSNTLQKIYGLHTLSLMDGLDSDVLVRLISDHDDHVARCAMKLAEPFLHANPKIKSAIVGRVDLPSTGDSSQQSPSPLHQQAAYTLGQWHDEHASRALVGLANRFSDAYLTAAILTSVNSTNVDSIVAIAADTFPASADPINEPFLSELLRLAILTGDPDGARNVSALYEKCINRMAISHQFKLFASLQAAAEQRGEPSFSQIVRGLQPELAAEAQRIAFDTNSSLSDRVAAIEMLSQEILVGEKWLPLLTAQHPPEVNAATVRAMLTNDESVSKLLASWNSHPPRLRSDILDRLVRKSGTAKLVLRAIEQGSVPLQDFSVIRQHQIRRFDDPDLNAMTEKLFGSSSTNDRRPIVTKYVDASETNGSSDRGLAVFKKHCATCHRLEENGNAVGPDLAALSDKSPRALLTAIMDPNRSIEERYISFNVQTQEGLVYSGAIVEETSTAITLAGPDGKQHTILRNQVEQFASSGLSLMPEGFEKEITTEMASDLIAYLRQQTTPRKLFPGNDPQVAPVRNDGSIRLFAMHAQIYGPNLVFEEKYRNLGFWGSNSDRAVWELDIAKDTTYEVVLEFACDASAAGNRMLLTVGDQSLSHTIESTGTWDNYRSRTIGTITIPAGSTTAVIRSAGPVNSFLMDFTKLSLYPQ
ncbi:MAG: c-type cytochrome, partial [Planctomycetales bacterium]|nr:c-type cytochrome [Planctomycetales bacterium]